MDGYLKDRPKPITLIEVEKNNLQNRKRKSFKTIDNCQCLNLYREFQNTVDPLCQRDFSHISDFSMSSKKSCQGKDSELEVLFGKVQS